jgi:hypothetical protein
MSADSATPQYGGLKYFPSGIKVDADYRTPTSPIDQIGNPLIDALPPVRDMFEFAPIIADAALPEYKEEHRQLPTADREQQILCLGDVFVPRLRDLELARTISMLIRDGYRARHPLAPTYIRDFTTDIEKLRAARRSKIRSKTRSAALFGTPGMGKTSSIEHGHCLFPQVILHPLELADGRRFPLVPVRQIVYLIVKCPKNGSMLSLCKEIMNAIDDVLGDTSYVDSARKEDSAEKLITIEIPKLIKKHHIGIIVIDDVQNLNEATSGGAETMLNQFGLMEEVLKIPVLLVGTFASLLLFQGKRAGRSRKLMGFKGPLWGPMSFDAEWKLWLEKLWIYQYTRKRSILTAGIKKLLHRRSAGIPDLAAKAYMLAQLDAFYEGEEVTYAILNRVFDTDLAFFGPFVKAIMTEDTEAIAKAEDLLPSMEFKEFIDHAVATRKLRRRDVATLGPVAASSKRANGRSRRGRLPNEDARREGLLVALATDKKDREGRAELLHKLGYRRSAGEFLNV